MRVRILGSAAGGGLPQWNCRCSNCECARNGSEHLRPRTQSSVAVSADGSRWFLLNVSPDIRQQILAFPPLGPPVNAMRGTGIVGCVLTDAELDHTAGLLLLREGGGFTVMSTPLVRRWLNCYLSIEKILARFSSPRWIEIDMNAITELTLPDGSPSGLRMRAFDVGRHAPRFVDDDVAGEGSNIGLAIEDIHTGGKLVYTPCVGELTEPLRAAAQEAACILIDGTFWTDDELIAIGFSQRTARQMGHVPVSDDRGTLAWLGSLRVRQRVYVHINNTNPILDVRNAEHSMVAECGVRVGADGDEFEL